MDKNSFYNTIYNLTLKANFELPEWVGNKITSIDYNGDSIAGEGIKILIENMNIARAEKRAICQDCGFVNVYIKIDWKLLSNISFNIEEVVNMAVGDAYKDAYLRKSICDPISRINTGTNTPVSIKYSIGDYKGIEIAILLKGGGSENTSSVKMLPPLAGIGGIADYIYEVISSAGSSACPPLFIGVGIGGNLSEAASIAKEAFIYPDYREEFGKITEIVMDRVSGMDIWPIRGHSVNHVVDIRYKSMPCHITGTPVAVSIGCYALRYAIARYEGEKWTILNI